MTTTNQSINTKRKPQYRRRWLAAVAIMVTLGAACGATPDIAVREDPNSNTTAAQSADPSGSNADTSFDTAPEADNADFELRGPDSTCPFISTDAVLGATGVDGFTRGNFGPDTSESGQYICQWDTGNEFFGTVVTMLVRNRGGGRTAEQLDNPNLRGESPGGDRLIANQGPMGEFLEVWTAEKALSNSVFGDQLFIARGPYIDVEGSNRYPELIIGWYAGTDPAEFNTVATALLEATDATYMPTLN